MRQLLELKGPAKLSDEVQWSIRMLLPKPGLAGSAGGHQQIAPHGEGTGITNALAVLADHAQQVLHSSHPLPAPIKLAFRLHGTVLREGSVFQEYYA